MVAVLHAFIKSCIAVTYSCFPNFPCSSDHRTGRATKYFQREREEGEQRMFDNGVALALHWKLHLPGVPTVYSNRHIYIPTTPKAERL